MEFKNSFKIAKIALLNLAFLSTMYPTPEEVKQEALKLGQPACFFNTNGEDPYLTILDPSTREAKIIKCGYQDPETGNQGHVKNAEDLENLSVLRLMINGFGGNYKLDEKYRGERKSPVAETLAKIILPNKSYKGTVLVDEYKANIPMFWVLKNVEELRAISVYMIKKLNEGTITEEEDAIFVPKEKTLLILKILNDKNLETLTEDDKEFLNTYFELFPLTDKDLKEFFEGRNETLVDTGFSIGGSNPTRVGESITQGIFRDTEKFFKDFEGKKVAIYLGGAVTLGLVYNFFQEEISEVNKSRKALFKYLFGEETLLGSLKSFINKKFSPTE